MFRYEVNEEAKCVDGAIFGFTQGTDPQGLLLFEARRNGETYRWHYAFARMATGSVAAKYGEKEIFSVDAYDYSRNLKKTFLWLRRQPIPKE